MRIVFDEFTHAEELLKKGFKDFIKYADLLILAKYYRYLGHKDSQIKDCIVRFYKQNYPDYNEVILGEKVDSAIQKSKQRALNNKIDVVITKGEIEKIRTLNNYRYEKILFSMLAIARHSKIINQNTSPRYFVNHKFSTVLTMAGVYATKADRNKIKHYLFQQGMIAVPKLNRMAETNTKEMYELLYADESSETDIIIKDMNNIISFYPFHCEVCGKPVEKTGKHQTMCKECWRKKRTVYQKELMAKKISGKI